MSSFEFQPLVRLGWNLRKASRDSTRVNELAIGRGILGGLRELLSLSCLVAVLAQGLEYVLLIEGFGAA